MRQVYESKWKNKREVLFITTGFHPEMIDTSKEKRKPKEVEEYNQNMSGAGRLDQLFLSQKGNTMLKKIIFHVFDNSFFVYKKLNTSKMTFLNFRDLLITSMVGNRLLMPRRKPKIKSTNI